MRTWSCRGYRGIRVVWDESWRGITAVFAELDPPITMTSCTNGCLPNYCNYIITYVHILRAWREIRGSDIFICSLDFKAEVAT